MSDVRLHSFVDESEIDTVLAEDIVFKGNIKTEDSLMIKGKVEGEIIVHSDLYIDEMAEVKAFIRAEGVYLKGRLEGDIHALNRVEIYSCARMDGDIVAPDFVLESGCNFNGQCTMKTPGDNEKGDEDGHDKDE